MTHPSEDPVTHQPTPDGAWLEARMLAVFVAVVATWLLIMGWKVLRQVMG